MRGGFAASLTAFALAGGGGGGGSSSPLPTPVGVVSITPPADSGIAIVGAAKSIPALVKGTDGSTLTNRTISWSSSSTAILTVGATGATGSATPVATGTATFTASVEGKTATMTVYVRNAPTDLASYKAMLPFVSQNGNFVLGSDISQAYRGSRLDHLLKSWNHFIDPRQPGHRSLPVGGSAVTRAAGGPQAGQLPRRRFALRLPGRAQSRLSIA